MKTKIKNTIPALALLALSTLNFQPSTAHAQGTAFTYQGRLNSGGSSAIGSYDLKFTVYDTNQPVNNLIAGPVTNSITGVTNGLFTVTLDFGAGVFDGNPRWLEIAARTNGSGAFTILSPRQQITPAPYAIAAGNLSAAGLNGVYTNAVTLNNGANNFNGSFGGDGAGLTNLNVNSVGGVSVGNLWQLGGNNVAGGQFLGSTNNQPLELRVNGIRAVRLEPVPNDATHSNMVNVVNGSPVNYVTPGVYGASIGGGGAGIYLGKIYSNAVTANFGVVGGGLGNTSSGAESVVAGGQQNVSTGLVSTVAGGYLNVASGTGAFIGGGGFDGLSSGGNTASGAASVIGGGKGNIGAASDATVGGGNGNSILNTASASTIGGGEGNVIQAGADHAVIGGGNGNQIHAGSANSTIGGGNGNVASGFWATVPGGLNNQAATNYTFAAGRQAKAVHAGAFVWADSQPVDFVSTTTNQFNVRAYGGVRLVTGGAGLTVDGQAVFGGSSFLRIITNATDSPNIVNGALANVVDDGVIGAVIAGGGTTNYYGQYSSNRISADFSSIGGGSGNWIQSGAHHGFIGGGLGNLIASNGLDSVIGGGLQNTASNIYSTVGGGFQNTASGFRSTVAGGYDNTASDDSATVGGGTFNTASVESATVGGGAGNVSSGHSATVAGGHYNTASGYAAATVGGGYNNTASGNGATMGGGYFNTASGDGATLGGGSGNIASGGWAGVNGGYNNLASGTGAFVGGGGFDGNNEDGLGNTASGVASVVVGGLTNTASAFGSAISGGTQNWIQPGADQGFIGGGLNNLIASSSPKSVIGGGYSNTVSAYAALVVGGDENTASGTWGVAVGGFGNIASGMGSFIGGGGTDGLGEFGNQASGTASFIGGGAGNIASGLESVVAGGGAPTFFGILEPGGNTASGEGSTIGGGINNLASGTQSTVAGGGGNAVTNSYATVPGGQYNLAGGLFSFAAGYKAKAIHDGAFVWADSQLSDFPSTAANEFSARATGGVRFVSAVDGSGNPTAGVSLAPGGTAWAVISDRNVKKGFASVDSRGILEKLAAIPITQWHYRWEDVDETPHIGPMAQDFKAAFYPGTDDKSITTLEFDGVELAAIQGLNEKMEGRSQKAEDRIQKLEAENVELKQQNDSLAERLNELDAAVKRLTIQK